MISLMDTEQEHLLQSVIDHTKLNVDVFKHMTTLAAGAIVLIGTFMDKIKPVRWRVLVPIAIGSQVLCILASLNAIFHLTNNHAAAIHMRGLVLFVEGSEEHNNALGEVKKAKHREETIGIVSRIAYISFCLGMILIGVYAIRNF